MPGCSGVPVGLFFLWCGWLNVYWYPAASSLAMLKAVLRTAPLASFLRPRSRCLSGRFLPPPPSDNSICDIASNDPVELLGVRMFRSVRLGFVSRSQEKALAIWMHHFQWWHGVPASPWLRHFELWEPLDWFLPLAKGSWILGLCERETRFFSDLGFLSRRYPMGEGRLCIEWDWNRVQLFRQGCSPARYLQVLAFTAKECGRQ